MNLDDPASPSRLATMPSAELRKLAERFGIRGARFVPRVALERGLLAILRARQALEVAKQTWRALTVLDIEVATPPELPVHDQTPPNQTTPRTRSPSERSSGLPPASLASETLARLYEEQGHQEKARKIRTLLRQRSVESPKDDS